MSRALTLAVALVLPWVAWADRRDLYTQLALGPSVLELEDRLHGDSRATQAALLAEGAVYYGLTHTLHVGGLLYCTARRDAAVPDTSRVLTDGTRLTGTLYLDIWSAGLGVLAAWRLDTGRALAPFVRLEAGASYHRYRRIGFVPMGQSLALAQAPWSEAAFSARGLLGVELRYADHLNVTLALGLRHTVGASIPWQFDLPISAGIIW